MTYKLSWDHTISEVTIHNPIKGENYVKCPFCPPRKPEHQNETKLAINLEQIPHPWRCNHCDAFGYVLDDDYLKTLKVRPIVERDYSISLSQALVDWFWNVRHISKPTLLKFRISMSIENMFMLKVPEDSEHLRNTWMSMKCINFNYYMDKMLINRKFRDHLKNFKFIKGASLILYNLDSIKDSDWAVITEGEFEPLAYYEAGITPVVSVPNGSAVSTRETDEFNNTGAIQIERELDMTYLDNSWDKIKHIKKWIIATDDDAAGYKLRELLVRRFGKNKCSYIKFGEWKRTDGTPCNDPNDVLIHCGKEQLAYSIQTAKGYPVDNVLRAIDLEEKVLYTYDNVGTPGLTTGWPTLDPHWRWIPGYFYALNGWPAMGKTTFILNHIVVTAALYKWKWGIYSPENYPEDQIIETAVEIFLGNTIQMGYAGKKGRPVKDEVIAAIREFLNDHLFIIEDRLEGYTPGQLRDIKMRLWEVYGCNAFFADPWKNLKHNWQIPLERYLNDELAQEVRLSTNNNFINIISAHPPTPERGATLKVPTPFMMYGGGIWFQSAYGMIAIQRSVPNSIEDTRVELHVQKMKNQKRAGLATDSPIEMLFDRRSNRYFGKNPSNNEFDFFPLNNLKFNELNLFNQF